MPKFRKKPLIVDAFRLEAEDKLALAPDWLGHDFTVHDDGIVLWTLDGMTLARWGDWIIRDVQGVLYPCKPELFEATYETVSEST